MARVTVGVRDRGDHFILTAIRPSSNEEGFVHSFQRVVLPNEDSWASALEVLAAWLRMERQPAPPEFYLERDGEDNE